MKTILIVLMCYFHQPVALYSNDGTTAILEPFKYAEVDKEAKSLMVALCKEENPETPKNFKVWHLDKLNDYYIADK